MLQSFECHFELFDFAGNLRFVLQQDRFARKCASELFELLVAFRDLGQLGELWRERLQFLRGNVDAQQFSNGALDFFLRRFMFARSCFQLDDQTLRLVTRFLRGLPRRRRFREVFLRFGARLLCRVRFL